MVKLIKTKQFITLEDIKKPLNTNNLIKTYDDNGDAKTAIFYKMIKVYVLVLLNKDNQPISCWANKTTKLPIYTKYVTLKDEDLDFKIKKPNENTDQNPFHNILLQYKPSIIYANTCAYINDYVKKFNPTLNHTSKELSTILNFIKNIKAEKSVVGNKKISFSEAKKLDSSLTLKEYKKIFV